MGISPFLAEQAFLNGPPVLSEDIQTSFVQKYKNIQQDLFEAQVVVRAVFSLLPHFPFFPPALLPFRALFWACSRAATNGVGRVF